MVSTKEAVRKKRAVLVVAFERSIAVRAGMTGILNCFI